MAAPAFNGPPDRPLVPGTTLAPEAVPPGVIVPPSTGAGRAAAGRASVEPLPMVQ